MRAFTPALALLALTACGDNPLNPGPTRSYCEAVCDWAVQCHEADRPYDTENRRTECITATQEVDPSCAEATSGDLGAGKVAALKSCVTAVDEAAEAGECDPFTGRIDEARTSTPPEKCLPASGDAVGVWEAARDATEESSEELCNRFAGEFCGKSAECIEEDVGPIPSQVTDTLGTPYDLCLARMDGVYTSECIANNFYDDTDTLEEPNGRREGARECLRDFSAMECDAMFTGTGMDPTCAGAFANNEQILAVAGAMAELAQDYADAMGGGTGSGTGTGTGSGTGSGTGTGTGSP